MQGDSDGDSDFQLIFVNKVPVAVQPDGSRMLTAVGDSARAELYKYVAGNAGQPKPVLLGIYNMPFQLTASPL
jgi:hypothetical protein